MCKISVKKCAYCDKPNANHSSYGKHFCGAKCAYLYSTISLSLNSKQNRTCSCCHAEFPKYKLKHIAANASHYYLCPSKNCDVPIKCLRCGKDITLRTALYHRNPTTTTAGAYCCRECFARAGCKKCARAVNPAWHVPYCDNECLSEDTGTFCCHGCNKLFPIENRIDFDGHYGEDYFCSTACAQSKHPLTPCATCAQLVFNNSLIDSNFCSLRCKNNYVHASAMIPAQVPKELPKRKIPAPLYPPKELVIPVNPIPADKLAHPLPYIQSCPPINASIHAYILGKGKAKILKKRYESIPLAQLEKPISHLPPLQVLIPRLCYTMRMRNLTYFFSPLAIYVGIDSPTGGMRFMRLYDYYQHQNLKEAFANPYILSNPYAQRFLMLSDLRKPI